MKDSFVDVIIEMPVLRKAELKYGALPDWEKEKVAEANAEMIERWAKQLFSAQTLKEVFE